MEDIDSSSCTVSNPSIQVQRMNSPPSSSKMARSPSRESIATELSFYSVSSLTSEFSKIPANIRIGFGGLKPVPESQFSSSSQHLSYLTPTRGPSPVPGSSSNRFLKVPSASASNNPLGSLILPELWMEEETDLNLIKSCAALSSALGLQKSFSTGDIVSHVDSVDNEYATSANDRLRPANSELGLGRCAKYQYEASRLGMGSRTCSMWVAVGDGGALSLSRTVSSQLPSPQGRPVSVHVDNISSAAGGGGVGVPSRAASFTAADLIRSVNKRVRQHYIRRRLLTTYKALERLTQSQFNLDRIATVAVVPGDTSSSTPDEVKGQASSAAANSSWMKNALTITDVEREQGRPLSKYERNMIIFNWLHTLDENQSELA